jgi:hypothetical protein
VSINLSYKGLSEIADYVDKRFGLPLIADPEMQKKLVQAIATRNLFVHRRGIVDQRFVDGLSREGLDTTGIVIGERLPTSRAANVAGAMEVTVTAVQHVDELAIAKFALPTVTIDPQAWWPKTPVTLKDKASGSND